MTPKAEEEITNLLAKKSNLEADLRDLQGRRNAAGYRDMIVVRAYDKESNKLHNQLFTMDERIETIKRNGISTGERNAIGRAVTSSCNTWVTIQTDRSLGCNGATKVGYYKPLAMFFEVSYTRYNGFMRNVKGCSSLADKTQVGSVTRLTGEEARAKITTMKRYGFTDKEVIERTPEQVADLWSKMIA